MGYDQDRTNMSQAEEDSGRGIDPGEESHSLSSHPPLSEEEYRVGLNEVDGNVP